MTLQNPEVPIVGHFECDVVWPARPNLSLSWAKMIMRRWVYQARLHVIVPIPGLCFLCGLCCFVLFTLIVVSF